MTKTRMLAGIAALAVAVPVGLAPTTVLAAKKTESAGRSTKGAVPEFAGHTYIFTVDNGNVFRNSYSADGLFLHWKTVAGPNTGLQETDELHVRKVGRKVYFVSWVEKSGVSVSHVMDLHKMTVQAFWSYDQNKRRVGELHSGKLIDLGPSS